MSGDGAGQVFQGTPEMRNVVRGLMILADAVLLALAGYSLAIFGLGVGIACALFMVVAALGLSWVLNLLIQSRVVIGAQRVEVHYLWTHRTIERSSIVAVDLADAPGRATGFGGRLPSDSVLPVLRLADGSAVALLLLAARSSTAVLGTIDELRGALRLVG